VIAVGGLIINRRHLAATLRAPFIGTAIRHAGHAHHEPESPALSS
jgi:cation:H+ antiporter